MTPRRLPPTLLALSPGDLEPGELPGFLHRLRVGVEAGLRGLLLRETRLDDGPFLDLAREAGAALGAVDGWLGLHDRAHLVAAAGAHGVHLGFRSLAPDEVRSLVGEGIAIGLSTHEGDAPATWAAADYRFFGPVFDTPSKRGLVEPVGLEGLAASVAAGEGDGVPVWALGGLDATAGERGLASLRSSGARGAALLSGLLGAEDVARATRGALSALEDWMDGGDVDAGTAPGSSADSGGTPEPPPGSGDA